MSISNMEFFKDWDFDFFGYSKEDEYILITKEARNDLFFVCEIDNTDNDFRPTEISFVLMLDDELVTLEKKTVYDIFGVNLTIKRLSQCKDLDNNRLISLKESGYFF